jgi:hypothetical protein
MTATAPHTEFRATNADWRPTRRADSFRLRRNAGISRAEWQALLQADVGAALLSVAAMAGRRGESAIWISHLNHRAIVPPVTSRRCSTPNKETCFE